MFRIKKYVNVVYIQLSFSVITVDFNLTGNCVLAVSLDVIIGVTIGVGLPCITICIIVIAVLVYRHKNKHRLDYLTFYN